MISGHLKEETHLQSLVSFKAEEAKKEIRFGKGLDKLIDERGLWKKNPKVFQADDKH